MAASSVQYEGLSTLAQNPIIGDKDFLSMLPDEILLIIFSDLNQLDVRSASLSNKTIYRITREYNLFRKCKVIKIFGPNSWMRHAGDPGKVPPLPSTITDQLMGQDFLDREGKPVHENYILTLIPESINGIPLTPHSLVQAIRRKSFASLIKFNKFPEELISVIQPNPKAHWILFRKRYTDTTRFDLNDNLALFERLNKRSGTSFRLPTVVEAVTCIFTWYLITHERLYPYDTVETKTKFGGQIETQPYYTYCVEQVTRYSEKQQLIVGGYSDGSNTFSSPTGLDIKLPYLEEKGIAAVLDLNS